MLLSYWTHDIKQNKSCKHVFLLHSHFVSLYFAYALGLHYLCRAKEINIRYGKGIQF